MISQNVRKECAMTRDIPEQSRTDIGTQQIDPDRISQVHDTIHDISDLDLDNSVRCHPSHLIEQTEQSIGNSGKEKKALRKRTELLSRKRSGKIPAKPLYKTQRDYLQSIPKDTIAEYLAVRKSHPWP